MPSLTSLIPKNIIIPDDIYMYIIKVYFNKHIIPELIEYTDCIRDRVDVYRNEREWPLEYDDNRRKLNNMYNAITDEKLWTYLSKEDPPYHLGYSFWDEIMINRISNHPLVLSDKHSNVTFFRCLNIMQRIAIYGWNCIVKD